MANADQASAEVELDPRVIIPQLAKEPNLWYERLIRYCLLGPARGLRVLYRSDEALGGARRRKERLSPIAGAPESWRINYEKWEWEKRSADWDKEVISREIKLWEKRRSELREVEWNLHESLVRKAKEMLLVPTVTATNDVVVE